MTATGRRSLARIVVVPAARDRTRGFFVAGPLVAPCALGRSGVRGRKREGDGATPAGRYGLVAVLYRADRIRRPRTALPVTAIDRDAGWCDDPGDRRYNRPVKLPYPSRHERLWREDRLYDIVVVIDFNLSPARRNLGSAIFLHIASPDFAPTEGCIAVSEPVMRTLLARIGPGTVIEIR